MNIKKISFLFFAFLPALFLHAVPYDKSAGAEEYLETVAAELPYLSIKSVLYARDDRFSDAANKGEVENHNRLLKSLSEKLFWSGSLIELLDHPDAKVRTLAAVAIFNMEDPSLLPHLAKLLDDKSPTFDGHAVIGRTYLSGIGPPKKDQSVGYVATKMIEFYMDHAGCYFFNGNKNYFDQYWDARKDRKYCASWFAVGISRATEGTYPTPPKSIPKIKLLRERIDKLPADDRAWILLWQYRKYDSSNLATKEEVISLCKELGADKLMAMLRKEIPSDDPDLQPQPRNNGNYKGMQLFVLENAKELLRPQDSQTLLEYEMIERNYKPGECDGPTKTSWWAIAAAELDPKNASAILHSAFGRFQEKYYTDGQIGLCIALWRLCGESESKFILDWFFKIHPDSGASPNYRSRFIKVSAKGKTGRLIVKKIINDERFDSIDWQSLEKLVEAANRLSGKAIVSDDEIRNIWHPFGQSSYDWQKESAKEKYPKETETLENTLADWRKRLRESF